MRFIIKTILLLSSILFFTNVLAATTAIQQNSTQPTLLPASKVIPNLEKELQAAKAKTNLAIVFPSAIPVATKSQHYYLSVFSGSDNNQYILNIDSTPTCNGIKYCNIGSIIVRVNGQVGPKAPGNTKLTEVVTLANGQKAFYTPAHAEADFWPTMLQWKTGNLAYYLSWTINQKNWDQKDIIIKLANSILQTK